MSFTHGKNTELWLGGKDISEWCNSLDLKADVDTAETTTFKKTYKTHIGGMSGGSVETGGLYDPDLSDVRSTLGVSAGAVLTAGPAGMGAVGDPCRLVKVLTNAYAESAPVGGVVAFKWGVMADGSIGYGTVLHPLVSETADGNGSTHTGPVGGSTNGAVAHLHVTGLGAGDTILATIEHSTDGTVWVTLDSFTLASAVGAERIDIPGTINRYTRVVWDLTSAGTPAVTFGAALARL